MLRRSGSILAIVMAFSLLAVSVGMKRLRSAAAGFQSDGEQLTATVSDAREIVRLRRQSQRAEERRRPEQDLISRVHAVMSEAGLPVQDHFKSLRGESDQTLPGNDRYRQQTVTLHLQRVEPRQVGAFLHAWTEAQPVWTISKIELVHERDQNSLDLNIFSAAMTFTAIYIADTADTSKQ
jgi:hypothetical protein